MEPPIAHRRTEGHYIKSEIDGQTANKLDQHKRSQKQRYDRRSQPLSPLVSGQAIRIKLPGNNEWSLGRCITTLPNRSYEVEVAGRRFRRNRRQRLHLFLKNPLLRNRLRLLQHQEGLQRVHAWSVATPRVLN